MSYGSSQVVQISSFGSSENFPPLVISGSRGHNNSQATNLFNYNPVSEILSSHFCRLLVLNKLYSTFLFSSIQSIFEWVGGILNTAITNTRSSLEMEHLSRILGLAESLTFFSCWFSTFPIIKIFDLKGSALQTCKVEGKFTILVPR